MIELVFTACLGLSQSTCEEQSLIYTDITPIACVMGAEPELAKWVETHPNWRIARWSCRYMDTTNRKA